MPNATNLQRAQGVTTLLEVAATLQRSADFLDATAERFPNNPLWSRQAATRREQAAAHLACAGDLEQLDVVQA